MAKILSDLQHRDIYTKSELKGIGIFKLGLKIFDFLKYIKSENKDMMFFLTHYFKPSEIPPHIKVGVRYKILRDLNLVNELLDKLCQENEDIISIPGEFKHTSGYDELLPDDIIVDYIICYSFEWLIKLKEKFGASPPTTIILGNFILKNRNEIENQIMGKNVFRNNISRPIEMKIAERIWERFIHHLCNSYQISNDYDLKLYLRDKGINILI